MPMAFLKQVLTLGLMPLLLTSCLMGHADGGAAQERPRRLAPREPGVCEPHARRELGQARHTDASARPEIQPRVGRQEGDTAGDEGQENPDDTQGADAPRPQHPPKQRE